MIGNPFEVVDGPDRRRLGGDQSSAECLQGWRASVL
jgi:hypothetical protein